MKPARESERGQLGAALRAAIDRRGVTLVWLKDRLADRGTPVSLSTLSYWRSGSRRPEGTGSLSALEEIEHLLALAPGELLDLVGDSRRTGPMGPRGEVFDDLQASVDETLDALGADRRHDLRDLSATLVVDVDESGRLARRHTRILFQATSGTIHEIPYVDSLPEPASRPPVLQGVAGATVVRRHEHPSGRVFGVILELDQPLTAPDTAIAEWVTELPETPELHEIGHALNRRNRETIIWVRFSPAALPAWVEEYGTDLPEPVPRDLTGTSVHAVRSRFGPGSFGVRWGYDEHG